MNFEIAYGASETGLQAYTLENYFLPRLVKEIMVSIPDCTNSVTFSLFIIDKQGRTRRVVSSIPKNANTLLTLDTALAGGWQVAIQASGVTGTSISVNIDILFGEALEP